MTIYNTGNPIGSTDTLDRADNSQNFDLLVNGPAVAYDDRLGVSRKSWAGLEADFAAFLAASGFETPVLTYTDGVPLQVDRSTQVLERASDPGTLYSIKLPSSFPVVLSGTWATDEPLLVIRVDQFLRDELAASDGGELIGFGDRTLADRVKDAVDVADYDAQFDGSDETAILQLAIDEAIFRGTRFVRVNGELNAPGTLTDRSNVFFIGTGKLLNVYRRTVSEMRDHSLSINNITPARHLANFRKATAPVVVIVGDSISTYTADSLGRQATFAALLEKKIRGDNPGKTITFHNRSIGGQTWSTLNAVALPNVSTADYPWYTVPTDPWLPYVEALNPDLVVLAFGMNDTENFSRVQFEGLLTKIAAWTKKSDVILVPNLVPSLETDNAFSAFRGVTGQEGRDYAAGYVRNYARRNGYGYIDLNRFQNIIRDGRDILNTSIERVATAVVPGSGAYIAASAARDFRFSATITGDAAAITAIFDEPSGPIGVRLGRNTEDVVFIRRNSGNFRLEFYTAGGTLYFSVNTATPIPTSSFTMIVEKSDNVFRFRLADSATNADVYVLNALQVHGGIFNPAIGYHNTVYTSGPFSSVTYSAGVEATYLPQITNDDLWGVGAPTTATQLPYGGNGVNHPTSLGASAVIAPAVAAADFRADMQAAFYTHPLNPLGAAFLGSDYSTSGSGAARVGNIGGGALNLMAVGADQITITSTLFFPVNTATMALGQSANRFTRAWLNNLNVANLATYADNAAAIAGGLAVGECYRTAAGSVQVRF